MPLDSALLAAGNGLNGVVEELIKEESIWIYRLAYKM